MVRDTSLEAFRIQVASGEFGKSKDSVLEAVRRYGPQSRSDLATTTGYLLSSVCGAVNKLIKENRLEDPTVKLDPDTKKHVHVVQLPQEAPLKTEDMFGGVPDQPETSVRAQIFNLVNDICERSGRKEDQVRKQIAGMIRQHTPERVLGALTRSIEAKDPLTYARALLRGKPAPGGGGMAAFLKGGK